MTNCRECGGEMKPSTAIAQTHTGIGDFDERDKIMTLSFGGPGRLIKCQKCTQCGWSVTQ